MFAERFSSEDRARIDDKEMEALNKAATTMLSGLRGTGTTYTYDSRGRMIESRERLKRSPRFSTTLKVTEPRSGQRSRAILLFR